MSKYERIDFDEVDVYNDDDNIGHTYNNVQQENDSHIGNSLLEDKTSIEKMTEREVNTIKETISSMTDEEQSVCLSSITSSKLWDELRRRYSIRQRKINSFNNIIGASMSSINPIADNTWDVIIEKYSDIENRFNEISKVLGD